MDWKEKAIYLLEESLNPIPQELNELDWKSGISNDKERLAQHISAFSNIQGGGILVFGINNDATFTSLSQEEIERSITRIDNIAQNRMYQPISIEHAVMNFHGHSLLFVYIPESHEKPVYLRGSDIYNCYTRSAGHTVRMSRQQVRLLIAESENIGFEVRIAKRCDTAEDVVKLLNINKLFELIERPIPSSTEEVLNLCCEYGLCTKDTKGWNITNLGAILLANDLSLFHNLKEHKVIIRKYMGNSNLILDFEQSNNLGYAVDFDNIISFIMKHTSKEIIEGTTREMLPTYPKVAIREFVANALVHQDFDIMGMPLTIEIFTNRMVITNPGHCLNDINRLIDLPPHSRNEHMAQMMLQMRLCERRGSGVDRAVDAIEQMHLPAYKAENGSDFTRITIYPKKNISDMTKDERIVACYQHCCLLYAQGESMNNQSLRQRFGLNKNQATIASHIIADTVAKGYIKSSNPESESRKFITYVPFYA